MENKNFKYLQFSAGNFALNFTDLMQTKTQIGGKWLPYVLMATALVLWIIFNIVAIESYQFSPYPLVIMNLILYCVVAVMADPNKSEDIFARMKEESDIDPENPTRMKDTTEDMGEWNEKTFHEDLVGDDLDVPGSESEMDVEQENKDIEDEENSYYSLGGDNHDDLEENRGLD
jgi:hypothetical protein